MMLSSDANATIKYDSQSLFLGQLRLVPKIKQWSQLD
jgi:hypothetical protein